MSKLHLTLACADYDRTQALSDHTVAAEGIDLNVIHLPVEETFYRMARHREFDIAEMSLSSYTLSLEAEPAPFVAIPVFPSRMFRHSGIYVSSHSAIGAPEDLAGKKVGLPEYQLTALVWIRGILQDEHGVKPESLDYFIGGEEQPGREEKLEIMLPPEFRLHTIGPRQTLAAMLAEGELDAVFAPRTPSTLHTHPRRVRRLFENFMEVERAYFRKTRIFPIMHTIVIRRELYEANRWIARALYKAFIEAKLRAQEALQHTAALKTMLPWQVAHLEDIRRELGEDWWPYGVPENRHVLDTFLRYHHEQGLSRRQRTCEELFAPECLSAFKI